MNEFEKKLNEIKNNIAERLDQIRLHKLNSVEENMSEDDIAQSIQNDDLIDSLNERERLILNQVESALQRIQDGTYGMCLECEEEINEKRLRAIPYTLYCKDCVDEKN